MNKLYICNIKDLYDEGLYKQAYSKLSTSRRDKVDSLRSYNDKCLSITSELLVNKLTNNSNIIYNEYGKPYVYDNSVYFNVSHSNEYVICATSNNEVGCDIEHVRDVNMNVAKRYFNEKEYLDIINSNNKIDAFFKYWVLKESFIKNIGFGLKQSLDSFCIDLNNLSIKQDVNKNNYYLHLYELDDYKYAICLFNDEDVEIKHIDIKCLTSAK
ncbi:MAG: 4'-phosphopantetheinyl transferase superfamily protein [Erysipelotrichaceae bacterium]|nr:4'-phosphopantetheinyl transferase superfamily protein [Erysipelotrichaceae bacterium]